MSKFYDGEKIIRERRQRAINKHLYESAKPQNKYTLEKDVAAFDKICKYAIQGVNK